MRVLFLDPVCPTPYSKETLDTRPLGGTEASVIRVAEALDAEVLVWQHNRTSNSTSSAGVTYTGPLSLDEVNPTHVIVLRDPNMLKVAKAKYPKAKVYLWCHDLPSASLARSNSTIRDTNSTVICVSDWHRHQTIQMIKTCGYEGEYPVKYIYNPIDQDLNPDSTPVKKNKLVFFSSPHKGLEYALFSFGRLKEFLPDLELYVSNPGYLASTTTTQKDVINLGTLTHAEILTHVRESFCVFYPNTVFPETFGLVFAEANAVGTPVFAHRIGAAREVLGDDIQPNDLRDTKKLIDRFLAWYNGNRPIVSANSKFRIREVVKEWINLLK